MLKHWSQSVLIRWAILLPGFLLMFTAEGQAGAITWSAATTISGDADVTTSGSLVGALVLGGTGTTTVGGVTFTGFSPATSGSASGNFTFTNSGAAAFQTFNVASASAPYSTLSTSYQNLLSDITFLDNPTTTTLTMNGLSVGASYTFEFWWEISNFTQNFPETANGMGGTVTVSSNTTGAIGGVGQFAIGTFTADTTSEAITFSGAAPGQPDGMNAFELRQTAAAVPEPSTLILTFAAGLALVGKSRLKGKPASTTDGHAA
jgi:hypothetical protein